MRNELLKQAEPYIRPGMESSLTVALVSPICDLGNKSANLNKFVDYVKGAAANGAAIVVFPETALTGYELSEPGAPTSLYELAETIPGPSVDHLIAAAKRHNIYVIMGMFEADSEYVGLLHNTAVFVGPEGLVGKYRKNTIECFGEFYCHQWGVGPGYEIPVWEIRQGWRIGIVICYDMWMPEVPRTVVVKGADLLLVPSAGPCKYNEAWVMMNTVRAMENQTGVAYCSLAGTERGEIFSGGRMAVEATGEVLVSWEGTPDTEGVTLATFTAENLYQARKAMPGLRDRNPAAYHALVEPRKLISDIMPYKPTTG